MLITILIVVGILGGLCQTIAGLASLVSYPALLALGLSPILANVTNTVSLVFSGVSSTFASLKELKGSKKELSLILPITLIGCISGSLLLFVLPENIFKKIVPFFILFAAIAEILPKPVRPNHVGVGSEILSFFGVFLVGVYSGYFGAAAGVLMLVLLGVISKFSFATYNAEKNFTFACANIISSIVYGLHTTLLWSWIIPLGCGFFIGGYLGPIIVRHANIKLLKIIISLGAIILAGTLFYQAYL